MTDGYFSSSRRQAAVLLCIALAAALATVPVLRGIEKSLGDSGPDPDLLYFSSPSAVKKMALGYDQLLSDIYWIRTVQYFGRKEEAQKRIIPYKNLATLLDITTTLDPGHFDAYHMGSIFLGEPNLGAGQPEEALKLLEKGIRLNPDEWRLSFDKGFIHYLYLDDYRAAGQAWLEASRDPGAPEWMAPLAARAFSRGGSMELARALWQQQYEEAGSAELRENARNRLVSLQVAEDLWTLEYLIQSYRVEIGTYPPGLDALASRTSVKPPMLDPSGIPYDYDPQSGTVSLSSRSDLTRLEVPETYKEDFLNKLASK
jgi:tetratricopeptide (TPR) repeat protein